ncbi:MAG TPA: protease SohB [Polyangiaceae bacterium]|nr:protease SohB [Polyangiaceae bacterium]
MDVLFEVLGFAGKALVVFLTFAACLSVLAGLASSRRGRGTDRGRLWVHHLNEELEAKVDALRSVLMAPKEFKAYLKGKKKKLKKSLDDGSAVRDDKVFVLDFKGDLMASRVDDLRDEVTALLRVARPQDEVVVRLESPGGAAHSYGFAAAQLARIRSAEVPLTVCVDRVAASGGYMMACVADKIVASPFAIIGSIGVAAPLPNVHRLLDRIGVEYENATAGRYKRTVSPFTPQDPEGRKKFQEELEEVHGHFKDFVKANRPDLDVEAIATGESWQAIRAAELGLVDELMTSDDYLVGKLDQADLFEVRYERSKGVRERLTSVVSAFAAEVVDRVSAARRRAPIC